MDRTIIRPHPDDYGEELGCKGASFCQAIRVGNQVYMMGQASWDMDGNPVKNDPAGQTDQAMSNIKQVLEEAGSSLEHIVKATVYVTDASYRKDVHSRMGEWMKGIRYCSTGVIVSALADPDWVVEIDVHAVIPETVA